MRRFGVNEWKRMPFLKFLLAMAGGILLQWYFQPAIIFWEISFISTFCLLFCFFFVPLFSRYKFAFVNGVLTTIVFFSFGALLSWKNDVRNNDQWLGKKNKESDALLVILDEDPIEKTNSFKIVARSCYLLGNGKKIQVKGKLVLYISKDSIPSLRYGDKLIIKKNIQEIRNAGNPGAFNYKRYALFQGITHQVYLKRDDYELLQGNAGAAIRKFIYSSRDRVLKILRRYIPAEKELGLAEALLIGYKNDLDKSLVQAYTNTGVVHIIAISGLHLGLIYWLLALLLKPLQRKKKWKWLRTMLIICGLWLFSLLAGAQPSILRSALMFTCIVLGESLARKTSVYNSMAVSAFILLCIDPFWLWDVGFQLSYAAVLSIIVFMRPVYTWFYIKNKPLDMIWKMNAVTISAQVLTVPLSIYHFHQFPNLFLFTNFLAVPLSSIILLAEIFLCIISIIPGAAILIGKIVWLLISLMNRYIECIESIPFAVWESLQISLSQAILLLLFSIAISYWLMERSVSGLKWGLCSLLLFVLQRTHSFIQCRQQEMLIVYNVPKKKATDLIQGRHYYFYGDSDLLSNELAANFYLNPSRIMHRVSPGTMPGDLYSGNYFEYGGKHILWLGRSISLISTENKPIIDLLVVSGNIIPHIKSLSQSLVIEQVVLDGSVSFWKAAQWKKDCDLVGIRCHDVTTDGAFVMNLR